MTPADYCAAIAARMDDNHFLTMQVSKAAMRSILEDRDRQAEKIKQQALQLIGLDGQAQVLQEECERLRSALLETARMVEDLKKPCGMDPESPQAVRNGLYMSISYFARAALKDPK